MTPTTDRWTVPTDEKTFTSLAKQVLFAIRDIRGVFPSYTTNLQHYSLYIDTCALVLTCLRNPDMEDPDLRNFPEDLRCGRLTALEVRELQYKKMFITVLALAAEPLDIIQRTYVEYALKRNCLRTLNLLRTACGEYHTELRNRIDVLIVDIRDNYRKHKHLINTITASDKYWSNFSLLRPNNRIVKVILGDVPSAEVLPLHDTHIDVKQIIDSFVENDLIPNDHPEFEQMLSSLDTMDTLMLRGYPAEWIPVLKDKVKSLRRLSDSSPEPQKTLRDKIIKRWQSFPQANNYAWAKLVHALGDSD